MLTGTAVGPFTVPALTVAAGVALVVIAGAEGVGVVVAADVVAAGCADLVPRRNSNGAKARA